MKRNNLGRHPRRELTQRGKREKGERVGGKGNVNEEDEGMVNKRNGSDRALQAGKMTGAKGEG